MSIVADEESARVLNDTFVEMCASTVDERKRHNALSVRSMLVLGSTNVRSCSSDVLSERESLVSRAILAFRDKGIDPSSLPEYDEVGLFQIIIHEPDGDDIDDLEDGTRRMYMRDGLRYILNAWARHRDRLLLACYHDEELASVFADGSLVEDHVHVIYERHPGDPKDFVRTEILDMVEDKCQWFKIGQELGMETGEGAFPDGPADERPGDAVDEKKPQEAAGPFDEPDESYESDESNEPDDDLDGVDFMAGGPEAFDGALDEFGDEVPDDVGYSDEDFEAMYDEGA